jgi:hypothetical protein
MGRRIQSILGAIGVAVWPAVAGCGSNAATYPVTGVVRFEDGAPVAFGSVEFRHEESRRSSRANLDGSGAFTLGTYTSDDGAAAGDYRVIVVQFFNPPTGSGRVEMEPGHDLHKPGQHMRVAAEFGDFATSSLRADVRPDDENHFEFVVKRDPS